MSTTAPAQHLVDAVAESKLAVEYLAAAKALGADKAGPDPRHPVHFYPAMFLVCHSMELALKAYLKVKQVRIKGPPRMQHDFMEIMKTARDAGLAIEDHFYGAASIMNYSHSDARFRYYKHDGIAFMLFDNLVEAVEPQIISSRASVVAEAERLHGLAIRAWMLERRLPAWPLRSR